MFAHVNEAESLAGSVKRSLHYSLWATYKSIDSSVGRRSRVNVQQAAARGGGDGCRDGIDHLKNKCSRLFSAGNQLLLYLHKPISEVPRIDGNLLLLCLNKCSQHVSVTTGVERLVMVKCNDIMSVCKSAILRLD